jgi:hypothetical protein
MSNPWMKKNPWLSLWLTGANMVFGSARAAWEREARRQNEAFMRAARRQAADFWLGHDSPHRKKRRQ